MAALEVPPPPTVAVGTFTPSRPTGACAYSLCGTGRQPPKRPTLSLVGGGLDRYVCADHVAHAITRRPIFPGDRVVVTEPDADDGWNFHGTVVGPAGSGYRVLQDGRDDPGGCKWWSRRWVQRTWAASLRSLPTIWQGHTADLVYENPGGLPAASNVRIWVHRTGLADGEPYDHPVTVETFTFGTSRRWEVWALVDGDQVTPRVGRAFAPAAVLDALDATNG